jgi:transposase InsO family protein
MEIGLVMERLYEYLGVSRQSIFRRILHQKLEDQMMADIRIQVKEYRRSKDIRAGSRNLYHNLRIKEQYGIGTTKFEQLMATHGMTLRPLKVRIVTTNSSMQSWNYSNLINGLELNSTSQVVVGDLTYVSLRSKIYYLFGLTDLYSARSVGISVSDRMRAEDACEALEEWIDLRKEFGLKECIHHTDGGGQYFSKLYLEKLANQEIAVSVALNCLQNGYAEQRNGLIKHHLMPTKGVSSLSDFKERIEEIIYFYNHERKQESLGWRTPVEYEAHINSLPKENRPRMKLFDFESKEKGFPRHMSTKS